MSKIPTKVLFLGTVCICSYKFPIHVDVLCVLQGGDRAGQGASVSTGPSSRGAVHSLGPATHQGWQL